MRPCAGRARGERQCDNRCDAWRIDACHLRAGDSASLSITGPTLLSGQFTTGTLDFDGAQNPTSNADLALNAGDSLAVAGNATVDEEDFGGFDIDGGAAAIGGNLAFNAYSSVNEVSDGGILSVAGSVTSSSPEVSISGTTGARIQLAAFQAHKPQRRQRLVARGRRGGRTLRLGAITVDSGASVAIGGPSAEPSCLTAPNIVDDGAIAVTESQSLTLDGGAHGERASRHRRRRQCERRGRRRGFTKHHRFHRRGRRPDAFPILL